MSYILDALKKSDRERQKHSGPTLQSIHRSPDLNSPHSSGLKLLLLVVLIALLFGAGWYYFLVQTVTTEQGIVEKPRFNSVNAIGDKNNSSISAVDTMNTASEPVTPVNNSPVQLLKEEQGLVTPSNKPQALAKKERPVMEFWQLPDPIQQAIPALTFSFHVYSDNPQKRTIIINNRRVKEGDSLGNGLTLNEVTPEGVVMEWETYRFTINVVESW